MNLTENMEKEHLSENNITNDRSYKLFINYIRHQILTILAVILIILASSLLVLSGLNHFFVIDHFSVSTIQSYIGFSLLGVTVLLLIFNVFLIHHPMFEYWVLIMVGFALGVIYAV